MHIVAMVVAALLCAAISLTMVRLRARRRADARIAGAKAEAAGRIQRARLAGTAAARAAETRAREQGLELRTRAEEEEVVVRADLDEREQRLAVASADAHALHEDLDARHGVIDARLEEVKRLRDRARGLFEDAERREAESLGVLEDRSGRSGESVRQALAERWIEEVKSSAAARVRAVEQGHAAAANDESAKRLMEIAVMRYRNHFLTERSISRLPLGRGVLDLLTGDDGRLHRALEEVANVQLHIDDSGEFVKLEGLDGLGREVARRAIARLCKREESRDVALADPTAWAQKLRDNLDRETVALGKRAFKLLKIRRPDLEIVQLVGALNYRTSYTQNQWLHAVEASFLAGMMAEELRLDPALARRATLMHDIGKALTHKIEGSHAVIGADIARRLGEDEVVANAIGAHHLDEPMSSAYAFLVAAADAMSGARPGARREFADGYTNRLSDLERIGQSFRGVDRAYAVHGGRELRVYVREGRISDLEAVELSSEIAAEVSEQMTFPGQIKVTVIRAYEATATAN